MLHRLLYSPTDGASQNNKSAKRKPPKAFLVTRGLAECGWRCRNIGNDNGTSARLSCASSLCEESPVETVIIHALRFIPNPTVYQRICRPSSRVVYCPVAVHGSGDASSVCRCRREMASQELKAFHHREDNHGRWLSRRSRRSLPRGEEYGHQRCRRTLSRRAGIEITIAEQYIAAANRGPSGRREWRRRRCRCRLYDAWRRQLLALLSPSCRPSARMPAQPAVIAADGAGFLAAARGTTVLPCRASRPLLPASSILPASSHSASRWLGRAEAMCHGRCGPGSNLSRKLGMAPEIVRG